MSRLGRKVALYWASKGIGAGTAKGLAAAGASVAVNYASDRSSAEAVVAAITAAGGRAIVVPGDVSKAADVARLFVETKAYGATLDVLVNNAAVYKFGPPEATTEEEFHREFNTNVLGPLLMIREAAHTSGVRGQHHQHRLRGVAFDPAQLFDLLGDQGCPRRDHAGARKGVGAEADSSEFQNNPGATAPSGRLHARHDRSRE